MSFPFASSFLSVPFYPFLFCVLPLSFHPWTFHWARSRSPPSGARRGAGQKGAAPCLCQPDCPFTLSAHARLHTHTHTLTGKIKRSRRPEVCFLRRPSPITTLLAGQWAPVSVLLAPVLYDAGNSISSRCWKINLDRAFPFLLRIRTHPGKPELP